MLWPVLFLFFGYSECYLWKNGIVHYAISDKDYDFHSREIIHQVLMEIQNLTCLKFFGTEFNPNVTHYKTLYISNPQKMKSCSLVTYDYTKNIIDMPIGYKCLNEKDISIIVVEMIRASIEPKAVTPINAFDLNMKLKQKAASQSSALLSEAERNYINTHYHEECDKLSAAVPLRPSALRIGAAAGMMSEENIQYYADKIWPLGIVLFGVDPKLRNSEDYKILFEAMTVIQKSSCIVFEEVVDDKDLQPKSMVWFDSTEGAEIPNLGFVEGKQTLNFYSFVIGDPGHGAHLLNNLMRILGVDMMSNRFDRDNYVTINWDNIQIGKQKYLEKAPKEAWIESLRYDFSSATHAPANFLCKNCDLGETTVKPVKDFLWQRTLEMGHRQDLSITDITMLRQLYSTQCQHRLQ